MKTKIHVFHEDPDTQLWCYGRANNLTQEEIAQIKKLLPSEAKIITINFADPENYVYPHQQENVNHEQDEQIQDADY